MLSPPARAIPERPGRETPPSPEEAGEEPASRLDEDVERQRLVPEGRGNDHRPSGSALVAIGGWLSRLEDRCFGGFVVVAYAPQGSATP